MDKVPEMVNLIDLAAEDVEKPKADKPITLKKSELIERLEMKPGEIKAWRPEQRPDFKKKVIRKRNCPFCNHDFRKLRAICPRCKNCQACGSFAGNLGDKLCRDCGNYDSGKAEIVPTIFVN